MKCLRCGHCCIEYLVVIVDDPKLGICEGNLIGKAEGKCKHLRGDGPGKYECVVHGCEWYKETPCFQHGQVERSEDTPCRVGVEIMKRVKTRS